VRASVCFSVACMGAYVRVFVSACVRDSVACQHACMCMLCVRVSVARLHGVCLACVHVYVRGEATRQSTDFVISGH